MTMGVRARLWFGVTVVVVLTGIVVQVPVAMEATTGFFDTASQRGLNVFVFFTIQANLMVGLSAAMLALGVAGTSTLFRVLRLTSVVAITVTFVVFHAALRQLQDLTGQAALADFLLHTASPILCVAGWLFFGPRQQTSRPIVLLTLVFLGAWGGFTLVRGEVIGWYPYPFMDPATLGYGRVVINLTIIGAGFLGAAAAAHWLDRRLAHRGVGPTGFPQPQT